MFRFWPFRVAAVYLGVTTCIVQWFFKIYFQDELKSDFETKADANDVLKNGWKDNLPGYNAYEKSYTNTSMTESYF